MANHENTIRIRPLFILMCVAVVLVAAFPGLALWLPSTMLDVR
jgi:C4-dicarboxylate transporter, DctM subunit